MKDILEKMTGIPASVGICEPIEGYGEQPHSALDAMKKMARIIEGLRWNQECHEERVKEIHNIYEERIEVMQQEILRLEAAYKHSLDPIVRAKMMEPVKIYWPPCVSGRGQTGFSKINDVERWRERELAGMNDDD